MGFKVGDRVSMSVGPGYVRVGEIVGEAEVLVEGDPAEYPVVFDDLDEVCYCLPEDLELYV